MHANATLEDRIAQHVAQTPIKGVASAGEIASAAGRRDRRTRIMGGLGTFVVIAMVLIGVGSALSDPDPSAVFAGAPTELADPFRVVPVEDGYIGLTALEFDVDDQDQGPAFVLLASADGRTWSEIDEAPRFQGTSAQLAVASDGSIHVLAMRPNDAPSGAMPTNELHHASSLDLQDWDQRKQVLPAQVDLPPETDVQIVHMVAAEAGVLVGLETRPSFELLEQAIDNEFGDREICDRQFWPGRYRARACGSAEFAIVMDESNDGDWDQPQLLFAPPGGDFRVSEIPETEGPAGQRLEIYRAGVGFGLAYWEVFESADGLSWDEVPLESFGNWSAAGRGDERVYRARVTFPGPDGPNGPPKHWGYTSDAGETVEWIEPESVYGDLTEPNFLSMHVGEGGWLATTTRREAPSIDLSVGESFGRTYREFTMTNGGMTLSGGPIPGPVTLTDDKGRVVRSWDTFEVANLEWAGFERTSLGVAIPDPETGTPIAEFTIEQWSALAAPDGQTQQYELLHSADGTTWETIYTSARFPLVQAIGHDEVLLTSYDGFMNNEQPGVRVLPLPVPSE